MPTAMNLRNLSLLAAAIALIACGQAARGQSVVADINAFNADTGSYNLISLGSATFYGSSDTQGAVAVLGSATFYGNYAIATNAGAGTDPSLYVAGTLNIASGGYVNLNNGKASTPALTSWTWSQSSDNLTANGQGTLHINSGGSQTTSPVSTAAPTDIGTKSVFESISRDLAKATSTGTISVDAGGNLVLTTGVTSGVAVFTLDASLLSGNTYNGKTINNVQINVPSGVNYVINVINLASGQTILGNGINFNSGANDSQLLWNLEGSTSITLGNGGNFYGSILAPGIALTDDTTINGQVVAGSFVDYGTGGNGTELHYTDFVSTVVPEPWWYAVAAVGLCGAALAGGKLLRRRGGCPAS